MTTPKTVRERIEEGNVEPIDLKELRNICDKTRRRMLLTTTIGVSGQTILTLIECIEMAIDTLISYGEQEAGGDWRKNIRSGPGWLARDTLNDISKKVKID